MNLRLYFLLIVFLAAYIVHAQEAICFDSTHYDPNAFCIAIYEPVCACDGEVYSNSCHAFTSAGLSCWDGLCPDAAHLGCVVGIHHTWSGDTLYLFSTSSSDPGDPLVSYRWDKNYTPFDNQMNTFLIPDPGENEFVVSLDVVSQEGCNAYCTYRFDVGSSLNTPFSDAGVKVYPNPTADFIVVTFDNVNAPAKMLIFDPLGQMVDQQDWAGGIEAPLNVAGLPGGTYFLIMERNQQYQILSSFLIQR